MSSGVTCARKSSRLLPLAGGLLALLAPFLLGCGAQSAKPRLPQQDPGAGPAASTGSPRLVFAHYFPVLPKSIDNKPWRHDYYSRNYLKPRGEGGIHAAYGGYLRDRPRPRHVIHHSDWRLRDMEADVREASSHLIDGFTLDLLALGGKSAAWRNEQLLMRAAARVNPKFKIMLMPDMSGSLVHLSPIEVAGYVAKLGKQPSAYRLPDGRLAMASFEAEKHDPQWWRSFLNLMTVRYDEPVAFMPLFQDERLHAEAFKSIAYGMGNWGYRSPAQNNPTHKMGRQQIARIRAVHAMGKIWMQPVAAQDERPDQSIWDESDNTQNLRDTWRIAIKGKANIVQPVTWNDFSEGTQLEPSLRHRKTFLDLTAHYAAIYKHVKDPLKGDWLFLTHRKQLVGAPTRFHESRPMRLRGGSSPARNAIEALALLRSSARVRILQGSHQHTCRFGPGMHACRMHLATGTVRAQIIRHGRVVVHARSPFKVLTHPLVQDLQYVGVTAHSAK